MTKDIADYINKQKPLQREIIKKVRKVFLKALSDPNEKMGWGVITFAENKFYLVGLKSHVNIGFAIQGLSKEEIDLFEGSGKTMRHIKIRTVEDIDEKKLVKLIKLVYKKSKCDKCG